MPQDDNRYSYNELTNEDKLLLLSHGYKPGELEADEERELLRDLREQASDDEDSERLSSSVPGDELDGTE